METTVVIVNLVTLVAVLTASLALWRCNGDQVGLPAKIFMMMTLTLMGLAATGNVIEHAGWSAMFDHIEGYGTSLAMATLLFFQAALRFRRELLITRETAFRQQRLNVELDHRVRNNLAAILGLIKATQQDNAIHDVSTFGHLIHGRVRTMSAAHNVLAESHWNDVDFHAVCQRLMASIGDGETRSVRLIGPHAMVPPRIANAIALPLHELYAALLKHPRRDPPPDALLTWTREDDRLELTWKMSRCDHNPADECLSSSHIEMIRGLVEYEMHGSVNFGDEEDWTYCKMLIPLMNYASPDHTAESARGAKVKNQAANAK